MVDIAQRIISLLGIPQQFSGSSALSGGSSLSASANRFVFGSSGITSESSLAAAGIAVVMGATAAPSAQSTLVATAVRVVPAAAAEYASSDLAATSTRVVLADTALTSNTSLSAAGGVQYFAVPDALTAQSTLTATAVAIMYGASAALSAQTSLNTSVNRYTFAIAIELAVSDMTVNAVRVVVAAASMSASSTLITNGHLVFTATPNAVTFESTLAADSIRVKIASGAALDASSSMNLPAAEPIYRLVLPTQAYAISRNVLFSRYPIPWGQSLLITAGVGEIVEVPDQGMIAGADFYFGGGRHHQLNAAEYTAVVNAGYGDLVEVA